jgi:hypothetical protein
MTNRKITLGAYNPCRNDRTGETVGLLIMYMKRMNRGGIVVKSKKHVTGLT